MNKVTACETNKGEIGSALTCSSAFRDHSSILLCPEIRRKDGSIVLSAYPKFAVSEIESVWDKME